MRRDDKPYDDPQETTVNSAGQRFQDAMMDDPHGEFLPLIMAEPDFDPGYMNSSGTSNLSFAANWDRDDIVKELIERGAPINARTSQGWSALHSALAAGARASADVLMAAGADVHAKDGTGKSMLHKLQMSWCTDMMGILVSKGVDLNAQDNDGRTPLYLAMEEGHEEAANDLIKAGASLRIANKEGFLPIHLAARRDRAGMLQQIIAAGGDVNVLCPEMKSPLIYASQSPGCVRLLLAAGANPDFQDQEGDTALHKAAEGSREESAIAFILAGARLDILNHKKRLPTESDDEEWAKSIEPAIASVRARSAIEQALAAAKPLSGSSRAAGP